VRASARATSAAPHEREHRRNVHRPDRDRRVRVAREHDGRELLVREEVHVEDAGLRRSARGGCAPHRDVLMKRDVRPPHRRVLGDDVHHLERCARELGYGERADRRLDRYPTRRPHHRFERGGACIAWGGFVADEIGEPAEVRHTIAYRHVAKRREKTDQPRVRVRTIAKELEEEKIVHGGGLVGLAPRRRGCRAARRGDARE
jgi:hypothetical protein